MWRLGQVVKYSVREVVDGGEDPILTGSQLADASPPASPTVGELGGSCAAAEAVTTIVEGDGRVAADGAAAGHRDAVTIGALRVVSAFVARTHLDEARVLRQVAVEPGTAQRPVAIIYDRVTAAILLGAENACVVAIRCTQFAMQTHLAVGGVIGHVFVERVRHAQLSLPQL